VDTRTTTSFIDSYVYVVEWGKTHIDVVEHSLSNAREVYDRLLGVVLNKANMSVLQRYERYRTTYYYRKYDHTETINLINPVLRGWMNPFAVGHSSECFSFIKDW